MSENTDKSEALMDLVNSVAKEMKARTSASEELKTLYRVLFPGDEPTRLEADTLEILAPLNGLPAREKVKLARRHRATSVGKVLGFTRLRMHQILATLAEATKPSL